MGRNSATLLDTLTLVNFPGLNDILATSNRSRYSDAILETRFRVHEIS
jgi:hypothetical protein